MTEAISRFSQYYEKVLKKKRSAVISYDEIAWGQLSVPAMR